MWSTPHGSQSPASPLYLRGLPSSSSSISLSQQHAPKQHPTSLPATHKKEELPTTTTTSSEEEDWTTIRVAFPKPMGIVFGPRKQHSHSNQDNPTFATKPAASRGGVCICDLVPEGRAALSQQLQVGDDLIQVNESSVTNWTYDEIMDYIVEQTSNSPQTALPLVFRRQANQQNHQPSLIPTTATSTKRVEHVKDPETQPQLSQYMLTDAGNRTNVVVPSIPACKSMPTSSMSRTSNETTSPTNQRLPFTTSSEKDTIASALVTSSSWGPSSYDSNPAASQGMISRSLSMNLDSPNQTNRIKTKRSGGASHIKSTNTMNTTATTTRKTNGKAKSFKKNTTPSVLASSPKGPTKKMAYEMDLLRAQVLTGDWVRQELQDSLEAQEFENALQVQEQDRHIVELQARCTQLQDALEQTRHDWKLEQTKWNQTVQHLQHKITELLQQQQQQQQQQHVSQKQQQVFSSVDSVFRTDPEQPPPSTPAQHSSTLSSTNAQEMGDWKVPPPNNCCQWLVWYSGTLDRSTTFWISALSVLTMTCILLAMGLALQQKKS